MNSKGDVVAKLIVDMSVSLDGYIAGPNGGAGNPLDDGGERLLKRTRVIESPGVMHLEFRVVEGGLT
jgi:hypothetical protein